MQTTTIAHAKLRLSESNVRKANGNAGLEALAASIAEHGLLQPLIVSPSSSRRRLVRFMVRINRFEPRLRPTE